MLTQHQVAVNFPKETIIWIKPSKISHYIASKRPLTRKIEGIFKQSSLMAWPVRKISKRYHPYVLNNYAFENIINFDDCYQFSRVADLVLHREDYKKSIWYQELSSNIDRFGKHRHKKIRLSSIEEVDLFFEEYALDLIHSMKTLGYDEKKAKDYGTAFIGENGEIYKSAGGRHRFSVAKIVDVPRFPLKVIGVHMHLLSKRKISLTEKTFRAEMPMLLHDIEQKYC